MFRVPESERLRRNALARRYWQPHQERPAWQTFALNMLRWALLLVLVVLVALVYTGGR